MSRVGKKPILIPEGVEVKIEGQKVTVRGPKGELQREVRPEIKISQEEGKVLVFPKKETKKSKAFWGLTRSLVANMVRGVKEGFKKQLVLKGLGFRAEVKDGALVLQVGFTHPVSLQAPEGVEFSVKGDTVTVSGPDKEKVFQVAASVRKVRPPEPYKGTGIRYIDEVVKRKPGKRVVTGGV